MLRNIRPSAPLTIVLFLGLNHTTANAQEKPATSPAPSKPATQTCTLRKTPMSPGDIALSHNDYAKAIDLYREESKAEGEEGGRAHDGMVRAMLRADKIPVADADVQAWGAAHPESKWQPVALAEVQWREGKIAEAIATIQKADNCNARLHADFAEIQRMSGLRASAEKQLSVARKLDPVDDDIEGSWVHLQPRSVQLSEVTSYLDRATFLSADERKSLERWKETLSSPPAEPCKLTTPVSSATIPYRRMEDGPEAPVFWGLDVAFNGKGRRLEIDTGASGLVLTKAAASSLHLVPDIRFKQGGIGDEGDVDSFVANVKTIKIGNLVFENCDVTVLGKTPEMMEAEDGLIGGDVFADFLLTLDFPGHILKLDPLPAQPNTTAVENVPTLATGVENDAPVRDRYIDPSMATWIKIFRSGHDLLLPTHLNGGPAHLFIVDTGAGMNLVSPQAAKEVGKISNYSDVDVYGISGKVKKSYTTGPLNLDFAGLRYPTQGLTAIDMSTWGKEAGVDVAGFLGAPILHQLTLRIDYRDYLVKFSYDPSRIQHCMGGNSASRGRDLADCQ